MYKKETIKHRGKTYAELEYSKYTGIIKNEKLRHSSHLIKYPNVILSRKDGKIYCLFYRVKPYRVFKLFRFRFEKRYEIEITHVGEYIQHRDSIVLEPSFGTY